MSKIRNFIEHQKRLVLDLELGNTGDDEQYTLNVEREKRLLKLAEAVSSELGYEQSEKS